MAYVKYGESIDLVLSAISDEPKPATRLADLAVLLDELGERMSLILIPTIRLALDSGMTRHDIAVTLNIPEHRVKELANNWMDGPIPDYIDAIDIIGHSIRMTRRTWRYRTDQEPTHHPT